MGTRKKLCMGCKKFFCTKIKLFLNAIFHRLFQVPLCLKSKSKQQEQGKQNEQWAQEDGRVRMKIFLLVFVLVRKLRSLTTL